MFHYMIDGFQGYRSRFDEIQLVQEVLEELPIKLGLQPAMQAFLIPYYNGIVPEDCGISAFLFLRGGHFTLHTFSFREVYFADVLATTSFDTGDLSLRLQTAFPCAKTEVRFASREENTFQNEPPDEETDFGPHLLLEIDGYAGPRSMDEIFALLDRLPGDIGMTPIMRPYVIRGASPEAGEVTSAMTMIAESHVSLHVFHDARKAYFDLFSCSFFDRERVVPKIRGLLPAAEIHETLIARGSKYRQLRTERIEEQAKSRSWLRAVGESGRPGEP